MESCSLDVPRSSCPVGWADFGDGVPSANAAQVFGVAYHGSTELCDAPLSMGGPCNEMRVRRVSRSWCLPCCSADKGSCCQGIGGDDLKEFEAACGAFDVSCSGRCTENFTCADYESIACGLSELIIH